MADEQKKDIANIVKANADISLNNIERKLKEQINEQINAEKKALRRCNQMLEKYRKQEDKSLRKAKIGGTLKSMLDNMDEDKLAKTREELANSSESCKDLEEAGKEWIRPQLDKSYEKYGENKMMELTKFDGYAMLEAIEFGVKWKEKQMMKNVVLETEVLRDSDGDGVDTPYESWLTLANTEIPELPESLGFNEGDKVKILIVKSE